MSNEKLEGYLLGTLRNLEKLSDEIVKTNGYTSQAERVKVLTELIREQLKNENIDRTTRQVR